MIKCRCQGTVWLDGCKTVVTRVTVLSCRSQSFLYKIKTKICNYVSFEKSEIKSKAKRGHRQSEQRVYREILLI